MTTVHNIIAFVLCSIIYQDSVSAQMPIWPIPTSCPATNPLTYTVHLQHDTDCTKFYKCDHGRKILFSCPSGLHFHPLLQVCDWPQNVGCSHVPSPTPSPPTPSPITPTPPTPSVDPGCPWPDPLNHTVHLPHDTDCTKFYKCDHGKKVEFDCPSGLHFNPVLQVCDWPGSAGCNTTTPTPSPPTTSPTTPTPPTPSVDPGCPWPDPLNHTVHLPHDTDCTKFYKCDHGKKVEFDCPSGLHFNPVLQVCDWPGSAGCNTTTPTTPTPPTPSVDPGCPWPDPLNYTVHLPHDTDCTKFYKCDHGKKVEFDCPSGLHFNPVLQVCDWPGSAGCNTTTPTPSPPTTSPTTPTTPTPSVDPGCPWPDPLNYTVHLPHGTDCTKFYKCDHGKKVEFDCPSGLHFNPVLQVCDWPGSAGCGTTTPTPRPTPTPTPSSTTPASSKCATAPHNYHIPHPTDCTKFYKCDHGIPVEFDCPSGLHFNARYQVCDWPASAGC